MEEGWYVGEFEEGWYVGGNGVERYRYVLEEGKPSLQGDGLSLMRGVSLMCDAGEYTGSGECLGEYGD